MGSLEILESDDVRSFQSVTLLINLYMVYTMYTQFIIIYPDDWHVVRSASELPGALFGALCADCLAKFQQGGAQSRPISLYTSIILLYNNWCLIKLNYIIYIYIYIYNICLCLFDNY